VSYHPNLDDYVQDHEEELFAEWLESQDYYAEVLETIRGTKVYDEFSYWADRKAAERLASREPEDDPRQDR
jgi:hypothetical protein